VDGGWDAKFGNTICKPPTFLGLVCQIFSESTGNSFCESQ
jgi:hypothetical protein